MIMRLFNKVAIIGVGLIGGSIGLALRRKRLAKKVIGVCRHKDSLRKAQQIGAIDRGTLEYKAAVEDADLVILAAPVEQIIKIGKKIIPYLKPGCVVTDAGSTKEEIVREIEKALPAGICFVGAHPLAGSEKKGVQFARADLFKGARCILTKTKRTKAKALKEVSCFWEVLGCRIAILTPQRHDKIVALISHLPHLAAGQLIRVAKDSLGFAAGGFWDTTRVASSDAEIWSDICSSNKKFIIQATDAYIRRLQFIRKLISKNDKERLSLEFKTAKSLRDERQK